MARWKSANRRCLVFLLNSPDGGRGRQPSAPMRVLGHDAAPIGARLNGGTRLTPRNKAGAQNLSQSRPCSGRAARSLLYRRCDAQILAALIGLASLTTGSEPTDDGRVPTKPRGPQHRGEPELSPRSDRREQGPDQPAAVPKFPVAERVVQLSNGYGFLVVIRYDVPTTEDVTVTKAVEPVECHAYTSTKYLIRQRIGHVDGPKALVIVFALRVSSGVKIVTVKDVDCVNFGPAP